MDQPIPKKAVEQLLLHSDTREGLTVPLRFRAEEAAIADLDRIEAFFRGRGRRDVNRSHILRVALERLVQDVYREQPEVKEVQLPTVSG